MNVEIIVKMEKSLLFAMKLRSNLTSTYEAYEKGLSKVLEDIGLELHVSQIKCLQYAEALWDENSSNRTSGFMLNGPVASGKTFSTCALLWRRREKGPQLLVCSAASLVSFIAFKFYS